MQTADSRTLSRTLIEEAIANVEAARSEPTGGKWLESLTVHASPHIKDWDIARCYPWAEWPERETEYPGSTRQDIGIDCVAVRSDGACIAIQCKSRQLDEHGRGSDITKAEIDSFASASAGELWAERWIVTNGDNRLNGNAQQAASMHGKPIKVINIDSDLRQQHAAFTQEECPHCEPNPDGEERRQSKTCMQAEAIAESVRILREHKQSDSGGLPAGQARGKIILPCGTGKTRISLRIIEELTPAGQLSIVLCPSIALVAQIRREYLQNAAADIRALAVCSDETAGYDPKKEDSRNATEDPTVDNSNVSAAEVKGRVTTNPAEIAAWIREGQDDKQVSLIFGTYQSGSRVAEALKQTGATARVLIADEAHRTAGLRRKRGSRNQQATEAEQRIRDFTLCHDNDAFPAVYRVYQTATPRIYDTGKVKQEQTGDWLVRSMDDETVFGVELYRKSYVEAVNNGWLADYRIIAVGINGPDAYEVANKLAGDTKSKGSKGKNEGKNKLTTTHFLRGLAFALAMAGATHTGQDSGQHSGQDSGQDSRQDIGQDSRQDIGQDSRQDTGQDSGQHSGQDSGLDSAQNSGLDSGQDSGPDSGQDSGPDSGQDIGQVGIEQDETVPIKSCIAFMNTVDKSKNMADDLQSEEARNWLRERMREHREGRPPARYTLQHLDASSSVTTRDEAKAELARATEETPHGIINVGIFGEGTDAPSLSAVAFLEARKSPIDVIQAVGRAMRTAPGKDLGYIICPVVIPPDADPEAWLRVSNMEEGWSELGQILLALRAHDDRIESRLADLLQLYIPRPPQQVISIVGIASGEDRRIQFREHQGKPGEAEAAVERVASGKSTLYREFRSITETTPEPDGDSRSIAESPLTPYQTGEAAQSIEATQIITGKKNDDGSVELRMDTVARGKPAPDGSCGPVDIRKSKDKARNMINNGAGIRVRVRRTREERINSDVQLRLKDLADEGNAIRMNLLSKSGLAGNRALRDCNILEDSIREAAHHIRNDGLQPDLDRHFGLDNLNDDKRKSQADGCTIAALLMMNAAMLHQRIAHGGWLTGISDLATVKNATTSSA